MHIKLPKMYTHNSYMQYTRTILDTGYLVATDPYTKADTA